MDHILSIVLFTPLAGFLVLLLIPSSKPAAIKIWANIASFIGSLVCLPLVTGFDRAKDFQFVEKANWIPSIGVSYLFGVDGIRDQVEWQCAELGRLLRPLGLLPRGLAPETELGSDPSEVRSAAFQSEANVLTIRTR